MNWSVWSEIEGALLERGLKPLLAVVPDNQDQVLKVDPPVEDFWDRVRAWQERGWTIALHGYQHRYVTHHPGIVTVKKQSEFAGVPASEQEEKLRRGLQIFNHHGIRSQLWIAPSNSFDTATVSLLPRFGISMICDGYFRFPFACRRNMFWIPQQLFGFRPAPAGVWTVCYHHNHWTGADLRKFREDLDLYGPDISCLDEISQEWAGRRSWWSSWVCFSPRLSPLLVRCQLKLASWSKSLTALAQARTKFLSGLQAR
jgi:peptidoglycan/xylan/chitin deacetylase (PgdA/CDA1 family)